LQDLLDEAWGAAGARPAAENETPAETREEPTLSPYQFNKKVDKTIDQYVRPMLQKDGGDLEVVDIKDKLVYCRLEGACSSCQGASQTLKLMVERVLKDNVDERIRVIQV
jgi:Fe-S cluster biogenesis protein NfuA